MMGVLRLFYQSDGSNKYTYFPDGSILFAEDPDGIRLYEIETGSYREGGVIGLPYVEKVDIQNGKDDIMTPVYHIENSDGYGTIRPRMSELGISYDTTPANDYIDKYMTDDEKAQFNCYHEGVLMEFDDYIKEVRAYIGLLKEADVSTTVIPGKDIIADNGLIAEKLNELFSQESSDPPPTTSESALAENQSVISLIKAGMKSVEFGPYTWKVLAVEGNKALLITEDIVELREYNTENVDIAWEDWITWEDCTLRKYLNGTFYNKFSAAEKGVILETPLANNDNPWFGTDGGNSTKDNVFLLSLEEVVKYFGDSGKLGNRPGNDNDYWRFTDSYDSSRIATFTGTGSYDGTKYEDEPWRWWLRSPGSYGSLAASVFGGGSVSVYGRGVLHLDGGVRPALYINLAP
jgi:hypothetical protein